MNQSINKSLDTTVFNKKVLNTSTQNNDSKIEGSDFQTPIKKNKIKEADSNLSEEERKTLEKSGENENEDEKDILTLIDKSYLDDIKDDFNKKEGVLKDYEFVLTMMRHLSEENDKIALVKSLLDLFKQIDVNGDKTMEWEEFSNYLIELGMVKRDKTFKESIKSYFPSPLKDKEKHESEIEQIGIVNNPNPKLCQIIVMEKDSKKFKVYDANKCKLINSVTGHTSSVIAADYIPEGSLIVTCSNDNSLNFWDSTSHLFRNRISTPDIQMCSRF